MARSELEALSLLSGDARAFREEVWASRSLVHRTDPAALTSYLTFDDVDRLVTSEALRTPSVRLARDGSVLSAQRYTRYATLAGERLTGLLDPAKVIDLFESGATLVLQGLHRYHAPLAELVGELELALGHPCQANAYLTPPGAQGFAVHSDTHDVFVFQTHGTKLWEVGDHRDPEGARREVLMEPGVSMYLPTGTPHAARAQKDVSLHVTIGINQVTWRAVLEQAVRTALASYDEHLPAGYLDDPGALADGLAERLRSLADAIAATDVERAANEHVRDFLGHRLPRLRGALRDRMVEVGSGTRLRRRRARPYAVEVDGEVLRLALGDRVLSLPARVRSAVAWVGAQEELVVDDVPGLDASSRVVLCRRLVREGALEVVS